MGLKLTGLSCGYDAPLVTGLDLHVPPGEVTCLLGPSGAGKTTVLRTIAGLMPPLAGRVTLGGAELAGLKPHERRVGFLFQEPALFPHLDVAANVNFGASADVADLWLERVGLVGRGAEKVNALSGGERQRVALARTLAAQPRAVLLDEPLSALDPELRVRLGADIKALLGEVPVLWVTHDEAEAARVGDRIVRMRKAIDGPE